MEPGVGSQLRIVCKKMFGGSDVEIDGMKENLVCSHWEVCLTSGLGDMGEELITPATSGTIWANIYFSTESLAISRLGPDGKLV